MMTTDWLALVQLDTTVEWMPGLVTRPLDEGLAVLKPDASHIYALDTVAADIWQRFGRPRAVREVCTALLADYDVDEATCRRQVLTLVRQWAAAGLVTLDDSSGTLGKANVNR